MFARRLNGESGPRGEGREAVQGQGKEAGREKGGVGAGTGGGKEGKGMVLLEDLVTK